VECTTGVDFDISIAAVDVTESAARWLREKSANAKCDMIGLDF
jgi:hypothetical protein